MIPAHCREKHSRRNEGLGREDIPDSLLTNGQACSPVVFATQDSYYISHVENLEENYLYKSLEESVLSPAIHAQAVTTPAQLALI
jgi:hypothetical protein